MSQSEPYVLIIALDFSKAFDTVRHSSLIDKIAQLPIPDSVHNWLIHYLRDRTHCTKINGIVSNPLPINCSIIQGSPLGPVNYILNVTDLKPANIGNKMHKYADDTYVIIPACNIDTVSHELAVIETWSTTNNLKLNYSKSCYMVVQRPGQNRNVNPHSISIRIQKLEKVNSLKILGVTIQSNLTVTDHVNNLVQLSHQNLYALKTLKAHGLTRNNLDTVCKATLVNRLLYACPAWMGLAKSTELDRLQAIVNRAIKWGLLSTNIQLSEQMDCADQALFNKVLFNPNHVLHSLLPPEKVSTYNLRPKKHNLNLTIKSFAASRNFIVRNLFRDVY
jgi:hypothetical protein